MRFKRFYDFMGKTPGVRQLTCLNGFKKLRTVDFDTEECIAPIRQVDLPPGTPV